MKNLLDYIIESRQYINTTPFDYDLFEKFMKEVIIDSNVNDLIYDDSPYYEEMKNLIDKKLWRWFISWCESYLEIMDKTSIREFYDRIKQIPLNRLNRVLGAGANGIVLDFGDKVIKVFYGKEINKKDLPFIKYCLNKDSNVFPKVYKIGKNWCVMEKLELNTPKCMLYMDIIDNFEYNGFDFIRSISKGKKLDSTLNLSKTQLEVYEWCLKVKQEMDKIKNRYVSTYPGDLVINNIGERKNGDIIFFDI